MEVTLVNRSVYQLPSKQRVGCIAYDGAADMQLWPAPGTDRDLQESYGDNLQRALDNELKQVDGKLLEIPSVIRVHPGRLHCDFLAWIATRPPEPGTERQPAPDAELLRASVTKTLEFAAERHVERIAFPALGAGPGELPREERLAIIVKAAHAYHDACTADGRSPGVEEVLVCEASGPAFRAAKSKVYGLAKAAEKPAPAKKKATKKRATRKRAPAKPKLTPDEVESARGSAEKYSMKRTYAVGDFFVHPKFGIGKVLEHPSHGAILVLFETGEQKRMVHARG